MAPDPVKDCPYPQVLEEGCVRKILIFHEPQSQIHILLGQIHKILHRMQGGEDPDGRRRFHTKKEGNLQLSAVGHQIDGAADHIPVFAPGGIHLVHNMVSQSAEGPGGDPHPRMGGVGQPLDRKIIFTGKVQLSFIYGIAAQRFLHLHWRKKQLRQLRIHNPSREAVDPFSHTLPPVSICTLAYLSVSFSNAGLL